MRHQVHYGIQSVPRQSSFYIYTNEFGAWVPFEEFGSYKDAKREMLNMAHPLKLILQGTHKTRMGTFRSWKLTA